MRDMKRRIERIETDMDLKKKPLLAISNAKTREEFAQEFEAYKRAGGRAPFIWLR